MTASDLDEEWAEAIGADLLGNRTLLINMVRDGEELTPDAREYIVRLLKNTPKGKLPAKFKKLKMLHNFLNCVAQGFRKERAEWKIKNPGRQFRFDEFLHKYAELFDVNADTLENKLRRSGQQKL
jgi:hypothetical protein